MHLSAHRAISVREALELMREHDLRGTEPGSREMECLAAGIYFESKGEPLAGRDGAHRHRP